MDFKKAGEKFAQTFRGYDDYETNLQALEDHFIVHLALAWPKRTEMLVETLEKIADADEGKYLNGLPTATELSVSHARWKTLLEIRNLAKSTLAAYRKDRGV